MIEIRLDCLKYFLTVILVVCTFFIESDARANGGNSGAFASASAYAGAGAAALSSAGAFGGAGDFSGVYDGHKEIRSYDNIGFSHDNDADRDRKSYGAVPGSHGIGGDGIKGSDHGYNKNDCSKCKWENDDYWERDEPEEEGDENDGDECDDGQYKPEGTRHQGAGGSDRGHKPGSHPPGVHKTGPTGVYIDDGPKDGRPAGPFGGVDYSVPTTGYTAPTSSFAIGSTPKPGSSWNTPFAYTTLKPGYAGANAGAVAGAYGTTSSSWPTINRGTTPGGLASSKPTWGSSGPAGNFVTTPKPGTNWDIGSGAPIGGQPSSRKPWNTGHDDGSISRPGQGWNTGFDNTPTTDFSQKPAPGWNTGRGPVGSFGVTPKPKPNWNAGLDSTSAGGLPFPRKPGQAPWSTGHNGARFGTTPKPGQSWNAPSGDKPEPSWNADYGPSAGASGCPRPDSSCTQGKQGPIKIGATPVEIDRTKSGESPSGISSAVPQIGSGISSPGASAYAGASIPSGIGSTPHGATPNFGKKDHPFYNKPVDTQTPHSGIDQTYPNTSGDIYGLGSVSDYNKSGHEGTWPSNIANTFVTTKRPFEGINSSGVHGNTFSPEKLPGSPTGSVYPDVSKPSYGSGITAQPASGSTWHSPGITSSYAGFPVSTGFGTTKSPFGHTNIPSSASFGSSYSGTGLKQPGFNAASSSASASAIAGASAFGTFPNTYSTSYIAGTTPTYSDYPGVKSSPRRTGPTYGIAPHDIHPDAGTGALPGKQPASGSKTWPGEQPGSKTTFGRHPGSDIWPGKQPESSRGPWPSKKPGDGSSTWPGEQPGSIINANWPPRQPASGSWPSGKPKDESRITPGEYPETVSGSWHGRQPGSVSGISPTGQPGSGSGGWPNEKPGDGSSATSGSYPGVGSGIRPSKQPPGESGAWPNKQPEDGSGTRPGISGCPSVNCGGTIGSYEGSNCGGGNYNCKSSCIGRDNAPVTHGPCGETISGPSGVNKTYYPAGTGNGQVPNIGNIYGSSPFNSGVGTYPGIGCRSGDNSCNQGASITPEGPVQWNSANPFLFGTGGPSTPTSDLSRPWSSGTTAKPIGKGNPFFDSSWSPKPEYSNNDKNVIPHSEGNTKPIGQGNPFLDNSKRRGDIQDNSNEGVTLFGGMKPEKYNPFGSDSDGPTYTDRQPDGYPTLGTPGSGGVKGGSRGRVSQQENRDGIYPTGRNPPGVDPSRCKLGIFGCGTPGSGSYETISSGKHPGDVFGGTGGRNIGNVPGELGDPGTGISRGHSAHPASAGTNLAGSLSGAYAGSFSNAQASSFANAKSLPFSDTSGSGNFDQARSGSWPFSGAQNQDGSNSGVSSGAFASSNSGSWSGNYPILKG